MHVQEKQSNNLLLVVLHVAVNKNKKNHLKNIDLCVVFSFICWIRLSKDILLDSNSFAIIYRFQIHLCKKNNTILTCFVTIEEIMLNAIAHDAIICFTFIVLIFIETETFQGSCLLGFVVSLSKEKGRNLTQSELWQKPSHHQKMKKSKDILKTSNAKRLRTDLWRSVLATTVFKLVLFNQVMGSQLSH